MLLYLHGPDSYRLHQRLRFFEDGFKKKYDPQGYNVVKLDGAAMSMEDFRQRVGQSGFLASKRFIVVRNIRASKRPTLADQIAAYLKDGWSDDNVLVFAEPAAAGKATYAKKKKGSGTSRNKLFTLLQEQAKVEEFPLLQGTELTRWIQTTVRQRQGSITPGAVQELAALVGSDLWTMSSEIDKLIHLMDGKVITDQEVKQMVRAAFDENIFHLTDALSQRNAQLSLRLLHDQLAAGSNELYLLTMLTRQFRILLQARAIMEREPNAFTVAARLGVHPFVAKKAAQDARRYTLEELRTIYRLLLDTDAAMKTTSTNPRLLFDLLVAEACGLAPVRP